MHCFWAVLLIFRGMGSRVFGDKHGSELVCMWLCLVVPIYPGSITTSSVHRPTTVQGAYSNLGQIAYSGFVDSMARRAIVRLGGDC